MMKRWIFWTLSIFIFMLSCGGTETKATMPVITFFDTYLKSLCDSASTYESGIITAVNKDSCPDAIKGTLIPWTFFHANEKVIFKSKERLLQVAEANKWMTIDEAQAKTCFDIVTKLQPYNPLDISLFDISECALAFKGKKIINDECYQNEECENGWCNQEGNSCPGRCVQYKKKGQSCDQNMDKCETGYVCRDSGCSQLSAGIAGDPCSNDDHCSAYLYCRKLEGNASGNCFKKKPVGSSCEDAKECITGLECSAGTTGEKICQGKKLPEKNGEDCSGTLQCNPFAEMECYNNKCQPYQSMSGVACAVQCKGAFFCDPATKKCQLFRNLNEPCLSYYECSSLYCNTKLGVCEMPQCVVVVK